MQNKQNLPLGLVGRAGRGGCTLNSSVPFRSLVANSLSSLPSSRGRINFLCRAKLNYQVFKHGGLRPASNRARTLTRLIIQIIRLTNTLPPFLRTRTSRRNSPPSSSLSLSLFSFPVFFRRQYNGILNEIIVRH